MQSDTHIRAELRLETREVRVGDDLPIANEFAQRVGNIQRILHTKLFKKIGETSSTHDIAIFLTQSAT